MKVHTPEISWHNRLPTLALDIAPINNFSDTSNNRSHYRLATGGADCRVYIWMIDSRKQEINIRAGLRRHQKSVGAVRFSGQNLLASGDDDGHIYLWKQKIEDPNDEVRMETYSNDFLNDDGFEDLETWQLHKVLRGHMDDICDLAWSRDGKFLISGSIDNTAILWDTSKATKIWLSDSIKGYVQGVAIDPHLNFFAALSTDRTLRVYNFEDKKVVSATRRINIKGKYKAFFCDDTVQTFSRRLEFSPDGQFLIAPTSRMLEKQPQTDELQQEQPQPQPQQQATPQRPTNIFLVFKRNSFNRPYLYYPIGREVALCARFSPVVYELRKTEENFWDLPYRFVFAIATSRSVLIYDSQQTTPIAYLSQVHLARLTDISWSSDGLMLTISSYDGYVSLVTFNKNEFGEIYTEPLLEAVPEIKEVPPQPPAPPLKIPETLTIRKYLIKRS